jgi:hypothetical protein
VVPAELRPTDFGWGADAFVISRRTTCKLSDGRASARGGTGELRMTSGKADALDGDWDEVR